MAAFTNQTGNQPGNQTGTAVVGYFTTGQDAHRAINALVDAGFLPTEIGAAFHIGSGSGSQGEQPGAVTDNRSPNVGGSLRSELGTTLQETTIHGGRTGTSSAASGTAAVQYASLGGGAGTPFDAAGRPGPISGSDLSNTGLPTELASSLPHDSEVRGQGNTPPQGSFEASVPPVSAEHVNLGTANRHESWGDKLKHVFGGAGSKDRGTTATPTYGKDDLWAERKREAQDFGTGEGHLDLSTPRRYSQQAFERSFSSYGVQPGHAQSLSQRIGHGGAIVTVHAGARADEAERVLEAHGGEVRLSPGSTMEASSRESATEVEVYGTVGRDYPGFFD